MIVRFNIPKTTHSPPHPSLFSGYAPEVSTIQDFVFHSFVVSVISKEVKFTPLVSIQDVILIHT